MRGCEGRRRSRSYCSAWQSVLSVSPLAVKLSDIVLAVVGSLALQLAVLLALSAPPHGDVQLDECLIIGRGLVDQGAVVWRSHTG